jgi:hypothetical protein
MPTDPTRDVASDEALLARWEKARQGPLRDDSDYLDHERAVEAGDALATRLRSALADLVAKDAEIARLSEVAARVGVQSALLEVRGEEADSRRTENAALTEALVNLATERDALKAQLAEARALADALVEAVETGTDRLMLSAADAYRAAAKAKA